MHLPGHVFGPLLGHLRRGLQVNILWCVPPACALRLALAPLLGVGRYLIESVRQAAGRQRSVQVVTGRYRSLQVIDPSAREAGNSHDGLQTPSPTPPRVKVPPLKLVRSTDESCPEVSVTVN